MELYRAELSPPPWWVISAGHGLLTGTALTGLVATDGPGRWAWLLVVAVAVAAIKRAWEDHAAAMAMRSSAEVAEVSPPDQPSGW